jgi:hypothetical protein
MMTVARADTTLPNGAHLPERCSSDDSPFWRAWHTERDRGGAGFALKHASEHFLLYVSAEKKSLRVLDRRTHARVLENPGTADAVVEDERGNLVGLLALDNSSQTIGRVQLIPTASHPAWISVIDNLHGNSAATLLVGNTLVVASFHRYATGARLFALDIRSGAHLWTADVAQMMVGHSEYMNDVGLTANETLVDMRGFESAGCYFQEFNLATGKRTFSSLPRR